jgi:peptidoglycan lytic transglycosylase F
MLRRDQISHGWAYLAVAAICAYAVPALLLPAPLPAPASRVKAGPNRRPGAWLVEVDGWHIEIAGTPRPFRFAPLPAESGPVKDGLASPYDRWIAQYAVEYGIDARLVSAIIHEESGFQPDQESTAGAYGLMQVREIAARDVGEEEYREPEANIRTGVRYLDRLFEIFSQARGRNRMALVLAAYNMGPGHVQDAQSLATRFGYDPQMWDGSLEAILPLLEQPQFYEQLPNGYAQGRQTVGYVRRVLQRYDHLRRALVSLPSAPPGS